MFEITGLSVLIPVYNYDIRKLVKSLSIQSENLSIPSEIICFDDCSQFEFKDINKEVASFPNVTYLELTSNCGRSSIRNKLALKAKYSHLLFLDCDGQVISDSFLKQYVDEKTATVLVGGRIYTPDPPVEKQYYLHWLAGSIKEVKSASERNKKPHGSFMFNNILISKAIYKDILLDETLIGYGHEDTKFGFELLKKNIPVKHIENPVIHEGLDEKFAFVEKSKEGVKNLFKITGEISLDTKLFKAYGFLKKTGLGLPAKLILNLIMPIAHKNLLSDHPKLIYLDLIKLHEFLKEKYKS